MQNKLSVEDVVKSVRNLCSGVSHLVDVDEGPGVYSRSPAFWIFPEKLGVKFHVYAVETESNHRVYLTFRTSPKLLSTVDNLIQSAATELGVKFKPAREH